MMGGSMLYSMKPAPQPQSNSGQPNSRGLEDDEELLGRDFDDEEFFGRDDLEAREPGKYSGAVSVSSIFL